MLERRHIEGRDANSIAADLVLAFDRFCTPRKPTDIEAKS